MIYHTHWTRLQPEARYVEPIYRVIAGINLFPDSATHELMPILFRYLMPDAGNKVVFWSRLTDGKQQH